MTDPIDAAIASAEAAPRLELREIPILFGTSGRPGILLVPGDLTDTEIHELAGFVLLQLPAKLAVQGRATGLVDALGGPIRA